MCVLIAKHPQIRKLYRIGDTFYLTLLGDANLSILDLKPYTWVQVSLNFNSMGFTPCQLIIFSKDHKSYLTDVGCRCHDLPLNECLGNPT